MTVDRRILDSNKKHLNKLDRIVFYVNKGDKDKYSKAAQAAGYKSLNAFIVQAINKMMEVE